MPDYAALREKVEELGRRKWDDTAIAARIGKMVREGIPPKKLDVKEMNANRKEILDRVQLLAEENNYYLKNCAQSTALALMEEFGLGNMDIIKALTPFPGIGSTGEICGGVSGSLIAIGLLFGSDALPDFEKTGATMAVAQQFITSFKEAIGHVHCPDIMTIVLGHCLNPGESEEAMAQFAEEKGFEKCGMSPGIGARLAAACMIDNLK